MSNLLKAVALRMSPAAAVEGLLHPPEEWLPRPVLMHGAHEFSFRLRVLGAKVMTEAEISACWKRAETASRRVRLESRNSLVNMALDAIEGDLTVCPKGDDPQGALLQFEGEYEPAGLLGRLGLAALMAGLFVASAMEDIASHLGD